MTKEAGVEHSDVTSRQEGIPQEETETLPSAKASRTNEHVQEDEDDSTTPSAAQEVYATIEDIHPNRAKTKSQPVVSPVESKEQNRTQETAPTAKQRQDRWFADKSPGSSASAHRNEHESITINPRTIPEEVQNDPFSFVDSGPPPELRPRPQPEVFTADTVLEESVPQDFANMPGYSSEGALRGIDGNIDSRTNSPDVSREGSVVDEVDETNADALPTRATEESTEVVGGEDTRIESTGSAAPSSSLQAANERPTSPRSPSKKSEQQRYNDKHGLLKKMRNGLRRTSRGIGR